MAGVDMGGKKGGNRQLDSEINMVPMIDLLMVTISFLLITAVWVNMSRMDAQANVPGNRETPPCDNPAGCTEPKLHVEARDPSKFTLSWKDGVSVVRSVDVQREGRKARDGVAFPTLANRLAEEYKSAGKHRDATDPKFDRAVVHASNDMPYGELIGVMDAVAQPKRVVRSGGKIFETSAFEITFATD